MNLFLLTLLPLAAAYSFPPRSEPYHHLAPRQTGIKWSSCGGSGYDCAYYEVPLDYQNPQVGKASLAVARYKATSKDRLGTIFINPGGPGGSGVEAILSGGGASLSSLVNGQYDIVSWDPRGVNNTQPRIECFNSAEEENSFWEGTIPRAGLEARGNFTEKADIDAFYEQVDEVDKLLGELGAHCDALSHHYLQYVGTVAVVKDMIALNDELEGEGKAVNFWGFSYGTVIGQYLVNMYPDRVGRVIVDGVVHPVYWTQKPPHLFWGISVESADEALQGFALACAQAGPDGCALAFTSKTTAPDILLWIRNLLDKAYDDYKAGGSSGYKSSMIRATIHDAMYNPSQWVGLAKELLQANNEIDESQKHASSKSSRSLSNGMSETLAKMKKRDNEAATDYSFQAITCADAIDNPGVTTKDVFDELVRVTRDVSQFFGPQWTVSSFYCHKWPTRAVERYQGPWDHKLSNPILVIGNEADPITPYLSAKFVADTLGDYAILVEQDDYGHASLAMHSDCTLSIVANYFLHNTLPKEDEFCGTNMVIFPGPGVTKSSLQVSSAESSNEGTSTEKVDDVESLKKTKRNLLIVIGALAVALVGLIIFLVVHLVLAKKKNRTYTPVHDMSRDMEVPPFGMKADQAKYVDGRPSTEALKGGFHDPYRP